MSTRARIYISTAAFALAMLAAMAAAILVPG